MSNINELMQQVFDCAENVYKVLNSCSDSGEEFRRELNFLKMAHPDTFKENFESTASKLEAYQSNLFTELSYRFDQRAKNRLSSFDDATSLKYFNDQILDLIVNLIFDIQN